MQVKNQEYLVNVFKQVSDSVITVNAAITAYKDHKIDGGELQSIVAIQQLATQHGLLIAVATMLFSPEAGEQNLPEMPKNIIGF